MNALDALPRLLTSAGPGAGGSGFGAGGSGFGQPYTLSGISLASPSPKFQLSPPKASGRTKRLP